MALTTGTRLGPYEIASPIGAGGMGEVYRARDTRLERPVAIKVLPSHLVSDDDRRRRFEREAKAISGLSHPNICTLHDVGHEGGVDYLVMEYLEGESLEERLHKGPLPLGQALRAAIEIADALDRAHRQGVVHRDLKPGNVMLTKAGTKLLDFGLAKLAAPEPGAAESVLATAEKPLTEVGTLLGTYQYMAPEQLEGRELDARADLFSFGALLHEMLTGHKAFDGKSKASLIASIMGSEPPPLTALAPMTPPALERLVRTCLAKDPDDRWQSAHDVAAELRWIAEAGSQAGAPVAVVSRRKTRERIAWAVAATATAIAAILALTRPGPAPAPTAVRTNVLLPERVSLNNAVIAPDGSRLVFSGVDATGKTQLWLRPLDSYSTMPLAGTEGGLLPFWSPDGRSIGFFADGKLKRVEAKGGAPIVLCDADGTGGAWAPSGEILFGQGSGPLQRLMPGAGQAEPVTTLDASRHENSHRYPFFLPDGRRFLYLALNVAGSNDDPANRIWVGSLDGAPARPLVPSFSNAQYADGHILFVRGTEVSGSLLAQPFDPGRLETSGEPITVADEISGYTSYRGHSSFSVSRNGTLLYDAVRLLSRLEWFDRAGQQTGGFGEPGTYFSPRIAPDGARIAYDKYDAGSQTTQIWIGDLARGVETRLTSGSHTNQGAVWSPDGSRIAFSTDRKHQSDTYLRPAAGAGAEEAVTDEEGQKFPLDWSPDGRMLVLFDREPAGRRDVHISGIPVAGERKPFVIAGPLGTRGSTGARLSPDGRWLAYDSDESGRYEVYVVSFPEGQHRVQISNAGGTGAKWTRGGREIVYTDASGGLVSVSVDAAHGFHVGAPRPLFSPPGGAFDWDVTADGERFLIRVPVIKSSSTPLNVVTSWSAGLKQ